MTIYNKQERAQQEADKRAIRHNKPYYVVPYGNGFMVQDYAPPPPRKKTNKAETVALLAMLGGLAVPRTT
jgi:hypothetical protein